MKKVFESQSLVEVESLQGFLSQASIPTTIKNQQTSMLAGEVPFAEVFPELWVLNDSDEEKALTLLDAWKNEEPDESGSWTCSRCQEIHPLKFSACWKCGDERPNP